MHGICRAGMQPRAWPVYANSVRCCNSANSVGSCEKRLHVQEAAGVTPSQVSWAVSRWWQHAQGMKFLAHGLHEWQHVCQKTLHWHNVSCSPGRSRLGHLLCAWCLLGTVRSCKAWARASALGLPPWPPPARPCPAPATTLSPYPCASVCTCRHMPIMCLHPYVSLLHHAFQS